MTAARAPPTIRCQRSVSQLTRTRSVIRNQNAAETDAPHARVLRRAVSVSHPDTHRHADAQREHKRHGRTRDRNLMRGDGVGADPTHHDRGEDKRAYFKKVLDAHRPADGEQALKPFAA